MEQTITFEQALARIGEIVARLERGDIALDDALGMFEEATSLVRRCEKLLSTAEQRVTRLTMSEFPESQEENK